MTRFEGRFWEREASKDWSGGMLLRGRFPEEHKGTALETG